MPVVFEEVTGEVDRERGSGTSQQSTAAPEGGQNEAETIEAVERHLKKQCERAHRAFAD